MHDDADDKAAATSNGSKICAHMQDLHLTEGVTNVQSRAGFYAVHQ